MYNLFVMFDDGTNYWETNQDEWVDHPFRGTGRSPERKDWDELRRYPCLFTYELKNPSGHTEHGLVVPGHIGEINDVRGNAIKYLLEDTIEISREGLADLGFEIGDEHRSQWTVKKNIDLYKTLNKWLREKLNTRPLITEEEKRRVWGDEYLSKTRVFLSHRAQYRSKVAQVRQQLEHAGYACFVAHEDIQPTTMWHNEIIHALDTMEIFIGLITDDFHDGGWPDQEVGYSYQRLIPRVFLRLGQCDPRGMVAREQALRCTWDNAGRKLVEYLRTGHHDPSDDLPF